MLTNSKYIILRSPQKYETKMIKLKWLEKNLEFLQ